MNYLAEMMVVILPADYRFSDVHVKECGSSASSYESLVDMGCYLQSPASI
jgi:hypothetical protein